MQTFLPYASYADSAKVLDRQRLGKQRVETKQIINALTGKSKGWVNHPASKMWAGHLHQLALYGKAMCDEWLSRGYKDSLRPFFEQVASEQPVTPPPSWIGNVAFHTSHQSNLVRKDANYYSPHFPSVSGDLPYIWPTP